MEIRLAKTAGFCFGVNRAVELTYNLLNEGHKVATLGPLIHNPQAVADMERRGALVADTVDDIPTGYEVIIRSHGVPRTIYDTLEQPGPRPRARCLWWPVMLPTPRCRASWAIPGERYLCSVIWTS